MTLESGFWGYTILALNLHWRGLSCNPLLPGTVLMPGMVKDGPVTSSVPLGAAACAREATAAAASAVAALRRPLGMTCSLRQR